MDLLDLERQLINTKEKWSQDASLWNTQVLPRLPCRFCRSRADCKDFKKIVEMEDVGVNIYRYRPPVNEQADQDHSQPREIIIIHHTMDVVDLTPVSYAKALAKCKADCPRCLKIMERLLKSVPSANQHEMSIECDHLHRIKQGYCPPCEAILEKFQSFTSEKAQLRQKGSEIDIAHLLGANLRRLRQLGETAMTDLKGDDKLEENIDMEKKIYSRHTDTPIIIIIRSTAKTGNRKGKKEDTEALREMEKLKRDEQNLEFLHNMEKQISERKKQNLSAVHEWNKQISKQDLEASRRNKQISKQDKQGLGAVHEGTKQMSKREKEEGTIQMSKREMEGGTKQMSKREKEEGTKQISKREMEDLEHGVKTQKVKEDAHDRKQQIIKRDQQSELKTKKRIAKDEQDLATHKRGMQERSKEPVKRVKSDSNQKRATGKSKRKSEDQTLPSDQNLEHSKLKKKSQHEKAGKLDKKDIKRSHSEDIMAKERKNKNDNQYNLMRELINEQLKVNALQEKMAKAREQERSEIERKAIEAENKIKEIDGISVEAEEHMDLTFTALSVEDQNEDRSVIDNVIGDVCEMPQIIRGEKLYMLKEGRVPPPQVPSVQAPSVQAPSVQASSVRGPPMQEPPVQAPPVVPLKRSPQDPVPTSLSPPQAKLKERQTSPVDFDRQNPKDKGVLRYSLSNRKFIDKGWTQLPKEMQVRKVTLYRMQPSNPELNWFEHNKHKGQMLYGTGEQLATFDEEGRSRLYYKSGRPALDYYQAKEANAGQRIVVYSSGERDKKGRACPRTVLAVFDYAGNGIVYDHAGKTRLKYNQSEGVILDQEIGPESHWKWHNLSDAQPKMETVMIDTNMPHIDLRILKLGDHESESRTEHPENNDQVASEEVMKAIELENIAKDNAAKSKRVFSPFQIRTKAFKINEKFSLRILDQASMYLSFSDGKTNLKVNIGMVIDPTVIVDQDMAEVGELMNSMDRNPARTDSVYELQRIVSQTREADRARVLRERRLNPPAPLDSFHRWEANLSRPIRPCIIDTSAEKITKCAASCLCYTVPCRAGNS